MVSKEVQVSPTVKVFKVEFRYKPGIPGLAYIEAFSFAHALDRASMCDEREVESCTDLSDIIVLVPLSTSGRSQSEATDATQ